MSQILWFRRNLRLGDNAILAHAKDKVLPIYIFDKRDLSRNDKRVTFIYESVWNLKKELQRVGLDLAIFYDEPINVFKQLKQKGLEEVLCSVDFDAYSKKTEDEIELILPLKKEFDSFILNPLDHLKKDGTPYKVFTAFYNSVQIIAQSKHIETLTPNKHIKKFDYDYSHIPTLESMGFKSQELPDFLYKNALTLLDEFVDKIEEYQINRDYFYKDASSHISVHLRYGLISPKEIFNYFKKNVKVNSDFFIRELFWREFYSYILFYFPTSQFENLNGIKLTYNKNESKFEQWCQGKTGVPIIDAAMIHLNNTGTMHNRLRMVVASFLTKNLFIDWKKGEQYFAQKLLDYETSSNIGSWQWAASTGVDSCPYFRIFNPYIQSKKFDKEGLFIKRILPQLKNIDSKLFHIQNGVSGIEPTLYPKSIVDISFSRKKAIEKFKRAKNETT